MIRKLTDTGLRDKAHRLEGVWVRDALAAQLSIGIGKRKRSWLFNVPRASRPTTSLSA